MLLLFLCPGTIPVPSCQPSCQTSRCAPPSSGCAATASSRLSTTPTTAPTPSCSVDPSLSPSGSGRGMRSSPSADSRPAWNATPGSLRRRSRPPGECPGGTAATKQVLSSDSLVSSPSSSQTPLNDGPGTIRSRTGFLHALDQWRNPSLHSSGTRTVSGHRHRDWTSDLSSCRPTPELGGSPVET